MRMIPLLLSLLFVSGLASAQDQATPTQPPRWQGVGKKKRQAKTLQKETIKTPGARGLLGGSKEKTRVTKSAFKVGSDPMEISQEALDSRYSLTLGQRGKTLSPRELKALATATSFYKSLKAQDFAGIKAAVSPKLQFSDPAFPDLEGKKALAMWKFISEGDIRALNFRIHDVVGDTVYGSWEADYVLNGRPIHNEIRSKITTKGGKIVAHRDLYDFDAWAKQALPGFVYYPLHLFGSKIQDAAVQFGTNLVLESFMKS